MRNLICILALVSCFNVFSQKEPKDDLAHYFGSAAMTSITYSIPRNTLKLPWYISAIISFGLNEGVGQLVEHSQGNNYSKKDLRINRYGTASGFLFFELFKQINRAADLENQIVIVNHQLINFNKVENFKSYSIELSKLSFR